MGRFRKYTNALTRRYQNRVLSLPVSSPKSSAAVCNGAAMTDDTKARLARLGCQGSIELHFGPAVGARVMFPSRRCACHLVVLSVSRAVVHSSFRNMSHLTTGGQMESMLRMQPSDDLVDLLLCRSSSCATCAHGIFVALQQVPWQVESRLYHWR